jgi:hypothetical protein
MKLSTHELAWSAGLFDGEGHAKFKCCKRNIKTNSKYSINRSFTIGLEVGQIDRRVLDRFKNAVGGIGQIYGPYKYNNNHQVFKFATGKFEHVQAVVALLWRWLSPVKRDQIKAMLLAQKSYPRFKRGRKSNIQRAEKDKYTNVAA